MSVHVWLRVVDFDSLQARDCSVRQTVQTDSGAHARLLRDGQVDFLETKQPERESFEKPQFRAEVKKAFSLTSVPSVHLCGVLSPEAAAVFSDASGQPSHQPILFSYGIASEFRSVVRIGITFQLLCLSVLYMHCVIQYSLQERTQIQTVQSVELQQIIEWKSLILMYVSSWMRHWATSRKVAVLISHGVTGIFH